MWLVLVSCTKGGSPANFESDVAYTVTAFRLSAVAAILFFLAAPGAASGPANTPSVDYVYQERIPLGVQAFAVRPWNSELTLMASAESPQFRGWRRKTEGRRRRLVDAENHAVRFFPRHIVFRVTAGTRTKIDGSDPFMLRASLAENDYLLKLRFRIKIFRGLRQRVVEPESVTQIGVPAEIPYPERIYRIWVDLGKLSMNNRVVLEVLAPGGERLCKFHLDLD
jgi:hypothetical protein